VKYNAVRVEIRHGKRGNHAYLDRGTVDACGQSWFVHFQDADAYGRIIHLQPMTWHDDWPVIGSDPDGDGIGEPVAGGRKPGVENPGPIEVPQASDEFNESALGLQWQWAANHQRSWWDLKSHPGWLRLRAVPSVNSRLWDVPSLLLQKFPAKSFRATARMDVALKCRERAGIVVFGLNYAYVALFPGDDGRLYLVKSACTDADKDGHELDQTTELVGSNKPVELRVDVDEGGLCRFSLSTDGIRFKEIGAPFRARKGAWVGARIGVFALAPAGAAETGYVDLDWFHIERRNEVIGMEPE
jgi:beta-xylosidase